LHQTENGRPVIDIPKVSVILPTFNRGQVIARAVGSVLTQDPADLEVVVIDDGSRDETDQVLRDLRDERIVYIKLTNNRGAAAARNVGIHLARGQFIAFQDSDNEWLPGKCAQQIAELEKAPADVGIVYTGIWRILDKKRVYVPKSSARKKEGMLHEELLASNFVDLSAAMVRKECFLSSGLFDERLPCMQDWELWIRMSKDWCFGYIDKPFVNAYYSRDSISRDYPKLVQAWEYLLAKHAEDYARYPQALAERFSKLAHFSLLAGEARKARYYALKAITLSRFAATPTALLTASAFGPALYRRLFNLLRGGS
jgi:glycosyltransferase involved in cell wall biosynthesis